MCADKSAVPCKPLDALEIVDELLCAAVRIHDLDVAVYSDKNYDGVPDEDDLNEEYENLFELLNLLPFRWCKVDPFLHDAILLRDNTICTIGFLRRKQFRRLNKYGYQIFKSPASPPTRHELARAVQYQVPGEIGFVIATYEEYKTTRPEIEKVHQYVDCLKSFRKMILVPASAQISSPSTAARPDASGQVSVSSPGTFADVGQPPSPLLRRFVSKIAESLSRKHSVDSKSLYNILVRCRIVHRHTGKDLESVLAEQRHLVGKLSLRDVYLVPDFDGALEFLGSEQALELFEAQPAATIANYEVLFKVTPGLMTPFLTIDGWSDLVARFLVEERGEKDSLTTSGRRANPRYRTLDSLGWFYAHLENLYPTKNLFDEALENMEFRLDPSVLTEKVGFAPKIPKVADEPKVDQQWVLAKPDDQAVARIIQLRGRLYHARLKVLELLLSALKEQSVTDLWQGTTRALSSELDAEEFEFLLGVDRWFYYDPRFTTEHAGTLSWPNYTGGLSDLVYVVGVVEKELTIGTCSRAATKLRALEPDEREFPHAVTTLANFYWAVKSWGWRTVADIYSTIVDCDQSESEFWREFSLRVYQSASNEFTQDVVALRQVKRPFAGLLLPHVKMYAEYCLNSLERTGALPDIQFYGRDSSKPLLNAEHETHDTPIGGQSNSQLGQHETARDILRIMEDDGSVMWQGQKYKLPPGHFEALSYIAQCLRNGNPSLHKSAICTRLEADGRHPLNDTSVRKWFLNAGGDAKRLVETGLIKSGPGKGQCYLDVSAAKISIVPPLVTDDE